MIFTRGFQTLAGRNARGGGAGQGMPQSGVLGRAFMAYRPQQQPHESRARGTTSWGAFRNQGSSGGSALAGNNMLSRGLAMYLMQRRGIDPRNVQQSWFYR